MKKKTKSSWLQKARRYLDKKYQDLLEMIEESTRESPVAPMWWKKMK